MANGRVRKWNLRLLIWCALVFVATGFLLWAAWVAWGAPWFGNLSAANQAVGRATSALTTVGGLGGAVFLTVRYREHSLAERQEERDVIAARRQALVDATRLLDSDVASTRIAGVTILAEIADTYRGNYRQQVVDILCGYLRAKHENEDKGHDAAVESTIVNTIATHLRLRRSSKNSEARVEQALAHSQLWCDCAFDFHSAELVEPFDFCGVTVQNRINFQGVKFAKEASFENSRFGRGGNFQDVYFSKSATFEQSYFHQVASFENARFTESSNFRVTYFAGTTSFESAEFLRTGDFESVRFKAASNFTGAKFGGDVNFWGVDFDDAVKFVSTRFDGGISFRVTHFIEHADFRQASFRGDACFKETQFKGSSNFTQATFDLAHQTTVSFIGANIALDESTGLPIGAVWKDSGAE